jgi:hypothetical protein
LQLQKGLGKAQRNESAGFGNASNTVKKNSQRNIISAEHVRNSNHENKKSIRT